MKTTIWVFWLMAIILISCETLKVIKEEGREIGRVTKEQIDSLGSELVREWAAKIRKEIARGRKKFTMKARAEVNRFAYNVGLDKTKAKITEDMKKEIHARVEATKTLPSYQKIVSPYTVGPMAVHRWEPTEEELDSFWRRSPKTANVREELQQVMVALWSVGYDFLVFYGERTCDAQHKLYDQGKSKVRDCRKAQHVQLNAVDIVVMEAGKPLFDSKSGTLIALATQAQTAMNLFCVLRAQRPEWENLGIRWGGDWRRLLKPHKNTFRDLYHLEIRSDLKGDGCKGALRAI